MSAETPVTKVASMSVLAGVGIAFGKSWRMTLTKLYRNLLVVLPFLALGACQPIDAALDCKTICTRYKDCFDGSYNVESCSSRCRTNADANKAFYTDVNRCEACITDRACASATFNCASECSSIVP